MGQRVERRGGGGMRAGGTLGGGRRRLRKLMTTVTDYCNEHKSGWRAGEEETPSDLLC